MRKANAVFTVVLFMLAGAFARGVDVKKLVPVREFKESLAPFKIGSISDIVVTSSALFVAVHQDQDGYGHNILVFDKDGSFQHKIGSRLGRGPDELEAPQEIAISGNEIMVNDGVGISFYSLEGKFMRRFSPFTLEISCAYADGKFYMVAANPNTKTLFEAYSPEGKFLFDFGQKFVDIKESLLKKYFLYAVYCSFEGKLLTDGSALYFINSSFGRAFVFDLCGHERGSFDLLPLFGSLGAETADFMKRWWVTGEIGQGEIQTKQMFLDADLSGDRLYILYQPKISMDEALQGKRAGTEILVLDKESFEHVGSYAAPVTSRVMAVEKVENGPLFYFFLGESQETQSISVYRGER
jgi:hypothetical protein